MILMTEEKFKVYPRKLAKNICKNKLHNGRGVRVSEERGNHFVIEVEDSRVLSHIKKLNSVEEIEKIESDGEGGKVP